MKLQSLTIQKAFIKDCIQIKPTMFFFSKDEARSFKIGFLNQPW